MAYTLQELGFNKCAAKKKDDLTGLQGAAAGGLGGLVATSIVHPLDTYGTSKQVGTWPLLKKDIMKAKGLKKLGPLYEGVGIKVLKNVPSTAIGFMVYNMIKNQVANNK